MPLALLLLTLSAAPRSPLSYGRATFYEASWVQRVASGTYDCDDGTESFVPIEEVALDPAGHRISAGIFGWLAFDEVRRIDETAFEFRLSAHHSVFGDTVTWTWVAPGRASTSLTNGEVAFFAGDPHRVRDACAKKLTRRLLQSYAGTWASSDGGVIRLSVAGVELDGLRTTFSLYSCEPMEHWNLSASFPKYVCLNADTPDQARGYFWFRPEDGGVVLEQAEPVGETGTYTQYLEPLPGRALYRRR